jgi:RNA polymerase sigma factor (sigma-70 family)
MVRPLKKRNQQGVLYTRHPSIEKVLTEVLVEPPSAWPARAKIVDRSDTKYLPMEVLVHLTRNSLRMQDYTTAHALLPCLGERCASLLKRRLQKSAVFNADDVLEETVARLYELFANDVADPADGVLDYYEVRFNSAFAALRANVIRDETAHAAPLVSLTDNDEEQTEDAGLPELEELSTDRDSVVLSAEKEELHRLIQRLPADERSVVVWKYLYGYKTESTDPSEDTVATRCGVSGSEVRARLRSAYARLKKWMEEKS